MNDAKQLESTLAAPALGADALELGELVSFASLPFDLGNLDPLLTGGNEITVPGTTDPRTSRLVEIHQQVADWLQQTYPQYRGGLELGTIILRTQEEAVQQRKYLERQDLLHFDTLDAPGKNTQRLLKICLNIDPTEPRVWAISESFVDLLKRYSMKSRIPERDLFEWQASGAGLLRLFSGERGQKSHYEIFLGKLDHQLRHDDVFQMKAGRRIVKFAPGAMWLGFTDAISYAQLRGRHTLELHFHIAQDVLKLPGQAPINQLVEYARRGSQFRVA